LSISLGDDHLNSINKIESVMSFIYPKKIISYDNVDKYINDSSLIEIDNLVFSVFSGNKIGTIKNIDVLYLSGLNSIEILKAVIRWSLNIKTACDIYNSGKSIEQAIQASTPYIFWKMKSKFERSIKLCKNLNLAKVIDRLLILENKMKFLSNIDNALLSYSLLGITNLINRND
jgi:DNA polymerase III delta subunit